MRLNNVRSLLPWAICLVIAASTAGGYLVSSQAVHGPGFPLDDAWIHLTYARNLGLNGEWAFIPTKPSAGSTAPLWTALLAVGFVLRNPEPYRWTYCLGILSLFALGVAGELYFRRETGIKGWLPLAGIFLAGEYHLTWAAVSGMETVLMAALFVLGLLWIGAARPLWGWIGALAGLAVWVRPDGLTLLGPAFFVILLGNLSWREKGHFLVRLCAAFLFFFLPYLWFNLQFQGSIWPNTFYAKQTEYSILLDTPLVVRVLNELALPLIGAGLLLFPGFLFRLWRAGVEKQWSILCAGLWFLGYAGLYALRLPVTYQYGRYLIPAMPIFFILGLQGLVLVGRELGQARLGRLLRFAYGLTLVGIWIGFYGLGAKNYARDVAIIETEMVATARWVSENTAQEAVIAVHDIGAMGYFGGRDIIDLAGLVTPEIIPMIRDEERLAIFLDQRGVGYLVTFPGWYRQLTAGLEVVFSSAGSYSPAAGGENMTVYRWKR